MNRAIIIMAKVPVAGTVKTRLQPFLSPDKCASLAEAFLRDAIRKAKSVCENLILAYSPAAEENRMKSICESGYIFHAQTGATLGERMSNAFEFAFAENADSVVMIGTDSPTFPAEFIKQAFEFLESNADLVLGKTADGGFYLIGQRGKNRAKLFAEIAWSSEMVFRQTTRNAERLSMQLKEVPAWYDVDEAKDFLSLRDEFLSGEAAKKIAPATFRWFVENAEI